MRDEHLAMFHKENAIETTAIDNLDSDEVQPLLFDLLKADKIESFRALLPKCSNLPSSVKDELLHLAATTGSLSMLELMINSKIWKPSSEAVFQSVRMGNLETFMFLLSRIDNSDDYHQRRMRVSILSEVLKFDSEEWFNAWEKQCDFKPKEGRASETPPAASFIFTDIIRATNNQPFREELLLGIWTKVDLLGSYGIYVGDALLNVASTTCSVKLAKFLLESRAAVDHRRGVTYMTPLHHAARQTTSEAAKLMELLLLYGADPNANASRSKLKIQEEKGAKGISKWLGMSWDELLVHVQEERQKKGVDGARK
jgi:hypothetical protein